MTTSHYSNEIDNSLTFRNVCLHRPSLQPHAPVAASQSSTLKKPFNTSTALPGTSSSTFFHHSLLTFSRRYVILFPFSSRSGEGGASSSAASIECTVVTFTFGDEPVPYRSKIPGRTVTLKQFKDILPKKGNYKYVYHPAVFSNLYRFI